MGLFSDRINNANKVEKDPYDEPIAKIKEQIKGKEKIFYDIANVNPELANRLYQEIQNDRQELGYLLALKNNKMQSGIAIDSSERRKKETSEFKKPKNPWGS